MKRSIISPPDDFSISPLFTALPLKGDAAKLHSQKSSLFARFENVSELKKAAENLERSQQKRLQAEDSMLRVVLEWLKVSVS